jgi:hypothetical protein
MPVNKIAIIAVTIILTACAGRHVELPINDFMQVVEQKKAGVFAKTIGKINYTLQYKPLDYVIVRELREDVSDKKKMDEIKKEYGKFDYYTLEITIDEFKDEILKYNVRSENDYAERVKYYAFKFQNDLKMIQEGDTVNCTSYHFERNYGLSPKIRFLLAFQKANDLKERTFICNEPFLGNSVVKINLDPNLLKDIPSLKLN